MISFIRRTIQAFAPPEPRLDCSPRLWRSLVAELERRGSGHHEAGAFLLGTIAGQHRRTFDVVYYDDLDPGAYESGVCVLDGDAFARLWAICRERGQTVVADIHTHPGGACQSHSDRTNPMVARAGHVAVILPDYARPPVNLSRVGVFEYRGAHAWTDWSPARGHRLLNLSRWSWP